MSLFALPTGVKAEEERDVVSSASGPLATNVYPGTIEMIYLDKSDKGALNYNIIFKTKDGKTVRETIHYSNRAGDLTYMCKKDNVPKPLPGYSQLSAMIEAITGMALTDPDQETETKSIKLMDWGLRKEVPVEKVVFMNTINVKCEAAIYLNSEEKTTKESGYKDGTGEFREVNRFMKFLDEDGLTTVERKAGKSEAKHKAQWLDKNEGQIKIVKAKNPGTKAAAATAGAPVLGGAAPAASGMFS
ncbi:MAG: hypothetical protein HRU18_02965 [Pseudoalteromonas sp.]|uniref:hypothetical protein n=1 Tax=Pseudoalteromonas sp. TaxID=53249 RepID=UPI001E0D55D7|nr:hypothetical protein [Pseudoalteromonas sp.]NRA77146.1 hypothetical protein [Pseudoalteromonas sp.]